MGSRRSTRRHSTTPALFVLALAVGAATIALTLAGCAGSGPESTDGSRRSVPAQGTVQERLTALERAAVHRRRVAYLDRVRDAVVRGAGRDFADGTGIGGPSFEACVKAGLREELDAPTIANLVAVYRRPYGTAYAAQALNALAAPPAASCGHRYWVPELVEAAHGLRSAAPIGAALKKLGVTYGPYLGMRCRRVGYGRCARVGIDVVFGHAATRVIAVAGRQTIRLRTPGRHNRIRYRDWVGTFTHADFPRRDNRRDQDLAYVTVELRVRFASGRRARAFFPHVLVSSGWG